MTGSKESSTSEWIQEKETTGRRLMTLFCFRARFAGRTQATALPSMITESITLQTATTVQLELRPEERNGQSTHGIDDPIYDGTFLPPHPVLKAVSMPDIPFDWNVTTTKWTFGKHSYLVLEKTLSGYSMYGRVDGKPWDNNGEDFFFENTDQLLTFLHKAKLLHVLSLPGA